MKGWESEKSAAVGAAAGGRASPLEVARGSVVFALFPRVGPAARQAAARPPAARGGWDSRMRCPTGRTGAAAARRRRGSGLEYAGRARPALAPPTTHPCRIRSQTRQGYPDGRKERAWAAPAGAHSSAWPPPTVRTTPNSHAYSGIAAGMAAMRAEAMRAGAMRAGAREEGRRWARNGRMRGG